MNTETNQITPAQAGLSIRVLSGPVAKNKDGWQCIAYEVALDYKGREVLQTPYQMGLAYASPAKAPKGWEPRGASRSGGNLLSMFLTWKAKPNAQFKDKELQLECAVAIAKAAKVKPGLEDVVFSLMSDGAPFFDALDFEEWASDSGYDTDSRKAERIFRECSETGRKLAAALPKEKIDALREWTSEY